MDLCRNFEYNYNLNVNLITFLIKYNLREFKNKYLRVYGLSSYANLNTHFKSPSRQIFHNCIKIYKNYSQNISKISQSINTNISFMFCYYIKHHTNYY